MFLAEIALALVVSDAHAQETAGFVVRLGIDTVSVERVTRTATQVRGEYVARSPRATHRNYTADLAADGAVTRFEMTIRRLADGPGPLETRTTIVVSGDTAVMTAPRGDSSVTTRMAVRHGAVPFAFGVMGLIEQLARQARAMRGAIDTVDLVPPGATEGSFRAIVTERGRDTLSFVVQTPLGEVGPWRIRAGRDGRLLYFDGRGTPFQGEAERLPDVDVAAASQAYANRPLGTLSARDTTRARLADSTIRVEYGRPTKRGRTIFGNVVPWNIVWRTGANSATHLHTPVDLEIGGTLVPAGTYTLWTLPAPGGWKLIVNKQTGQWGTLYDAAQDLARIDMKVETLAQPVERFTIAIEPAGAGAATLQLSWDTTRASVPVKARAASR